MGKKWTNFDQKEREGLFGNVYNDLIAMAVSRLKCSTRLVLPVSETDGTRESLWGL